MSRQGGVNVKSKVKTKRGKIENENKQLAQATDSLLTQTKQKRTGKITIKAIISLLGGTRKLCRAFTKFALEDSNLKGELKPLWDTLSRYRISPEEFFREMDLEKFLVTKWRPGGRINELLIFWNKPLMNFLRIEFSEKSFQNWLALRAEGRKNPKIDTSWKISNSQNNTLSELEINEFKKIPTEFGYDFKTGKNAEAEAKILYLDGSFFKYNPKSNKMLLLTPVELKSRKNQGDLNDQIANIPPRLQESAIISFKKDGKTFEVPSENVFVLAGESLGAFYGNINRPFDSVNVAFESGGVFNAADMRPKFTSDLEFFARLKLQYANPKVAPNAIEEILFKMKAEFKKNTKLDKG